MSGGPLIPAFDSEYVIQQSLERNNVNFVAETLHFHLDERFGTILFIRSNFIV